MNNIEKQICEAIDIIVNKTVADANYDRTIQGTVVSCEDATIGQYKISYQDSTFYAYSGNSDITYTNGSTVYILIPGNDMNADKTILGTVKKLGINYVATIEDEEAYEVIGKNTVTSSAVYELSSYHKEKFVKTLYDKSYTSQQNLISLNLTDVSTYIKNAGSLLIAANIQTKLASEQQFRGNYGLVVGLDFLDNALNTEVTRYYVLDVDAMRGNPYKILNYTRQYSIFDIDGENFVRVSNISLFVEDFPNSKEENECNADIFIKDIELCGAERLDTEGINTSMLTFLTLQGTYFDKSSLDSDIRTLKAQVRVKGKVADATAQKLSFYWFIEHAGITSQNQYYNKYGGQGWKCLNDFNVIKANEDYETDVVEWIPAGDTFTVKKTDIIAKEVKYKCAVVYDGTVLTKTIVIKNLSSNYNIDIISDLGTQFYFDIGYPTLTCRVNGETAPGKYTYSWAVTDNADNFNSLPDTPQYNSAYQQAYNNYYNLLKNIEDEKVALEPNRATLEAYRIELVRFDTINRVDSNIIYHLNVNTITDFSVYRCTVYLDGVYIGTASITLVNSLTAEGQYNLIIHNGSKTYKYNENGVSPTSSSLDSPIDIEALTFSVYDNLGNIIDDNVITQKAKIRWLVPSENTMIDVSDLPDGWSYTEADGIRTYTANTGIALSFPYKIKSRYDITCTNNDIIIMIEYQDKTNGISVSLSNRTSFTFIKEGESGTNGTEFVCKIVPNIVSGAEMPAYPMITENIYHQGVLNYTPINSNKYLRVQLWHNENKVLDSVTSATSTEGKKATITWEILKNKYTADVSDISALSVGSESGVFTFNGYKYGESAPANIVKATVEYDGVTYYATLPFITAKITNKDYQIKLKDNTGFSQVLYSSDGQTPKYDNTKPFEAIVTQNIDGYWEDISTKSTSAYEVTYNWACNLGAIYEDSKWSNVSAFSKVSGATTPNTYMVKPLDSYDGQCVTNGIEVAVVKSGNELCRMHIPIHMYLNRYGNSAINGWDGNSVQVDEEGGFILAPQVGAGIKEDDNSFTGVVMGKVKETNKSTVDIGLIGYAQGVRSIFLDAQTGKALFGANGKGQVVIDPSSNKAELYSGNYNYKNDGTGTGMKIDLTTPYIKFGSGNFEVNEKGHLTAKGGGSIASWQITDTELYSPSPYASRKLTLDAGNQKIYSGTKTTADSTKDGFFLSPDNLTLGSKFKASASGSLEIGTGAAANNNSKRWTIDGDSSNSYIKYGTKGNTGSVYIGTSEIQLGKGFWVNAAGLLKVGRLDGKYWTIAGKTNGNSPAFISYNHTVTYDTNGELSEYPTIGSDHSSSSMYMGTDGIAIGSRFLISAENSGTVKIMSNAGAGLGDTTDGFYLSSDGLRVGNKFKVTNGEMLVGSLSGKHWTINGNSSRAYIAYGGTTSYSAASSDDDSGADIYLGTDGISLGKRFSVSKQGVLNAYSGTIGGWTLSKTKFTSSNGKMEINSAGSIKGGSTYDWEINTAGTATFKRIKADVGGTIGNCTISENGLYSSGWHINSDGSASFSNVTVTGGSISIGGKSKINSDGSASFSNVSITGGSLNISNGKAKINSDGSASFSNVTVTGGSITLGGTTLNSSGTSLTANQTKVGSSSLQQYVEDLAVNKLSANDVTIKASLNVTGSSSSYYLRMGKGTNNPELSGINLGSQGIRITKGGSSYYGQDYSDIKFISSIDSLSVSVGTTLEVVTSVSVSLSYKYRKFTTKDGIMTGLTDSQSDSVHDSDS